ncbi:enoyl-CoA hydratase-related protein [Thalassotalea castellviae]|uniref:Enoyl-CoA hydratase-related protein n=1 Tax=Thalassotalea castellviae TaxID=3075612 RepID=A0ABU3A440_9GAMM|nr:enoyl-CoA hydratase-related protein [Thalassotalea sp. W431]MDT0604943.1 enoyl-CoA hydratase-related protein [Thalassotalea sp. W431]
MDNLILSEIENNVLTITLNRFDKKNALNTVMYQTLCETFNHAQTNASIHCVLIQGNEHCFCAGNDLADFLQHADSQEELAAFAFVKTLASFTKPIVAAVAGPAVGIGTTMLLHCDMVFSTADAKFKLPFSQLGLCPEAASSVLLPLRIGHNKAFELLVLGDLFTGQQAYNYGIVNAICLADELLLTAKKSAKYIASLPADATQTSRALMKQATQSQVLSAIEKEGAEFARLVKTDTCKKILASFFN